MNALNTHCLDSPSLIHFLTPISGVNPLLNCIFKIKNYLLITSFSGHYHLYLQNSLKNGLRIFLPNNILPISASVSAHIVNDLQFSFLLYLSPSTLQGTAEVSLYGVFSTNLLFNDFPIWVILPQPRSSGAHNKDFKQIQKHKLRFRPYSLKSPRGNLTSSIF